jgi:hypothetical protein
VLDGAVEGWDALLMCTHEREKDASSQAVYKSVLDVCVLLGSRAIRPLLFRLNNLVKVIQRQDFTFEELVVKLTTFFDFVDSVYVHLVSGFAGPAYQQFLMIDGDGPLKWDGDALVYYIERMEGVKHHVTFDEHEITREI